MWTLKRLGDPAITPETVQDLRFERMIPVRSEWLNATPVIADGLLFVGDTWRDYAPDKALRTFPAKVEGTKVRARPESFADHYSQARQFFLSQTETEQRHRMAEMRRTRDNALCEQRLNAL